MWPASPRSGLPPVHLRGCNLYTFIFLLPQLTQLFGCHCLVNGLIIYSAACVSPSTPFSFTSSSQLLKSYWLNVDIPTELPNPASSRPRLGWLPNLQIPQRAFLCSLVLHMTLMSTAQLCLSDCTDSVRTMSLTWTDPKNQSPCFSDWLRHEHLIKASLESFPTSFPSRVEEENLFPSEQWDWSWQWPSF